MKVILTESQYNRIILKEQNLWDEFKSWWNIPSRSLDMDVGNYDKDEEKNKEYTDKIIRWMEEKLSTPPLTQRKLTAEEKKEIEKILADTHHIEEKRAKTYQYFHDLYKEEIGRDY